MSKQQYSPFGKIGTGIVLLLLWLITAAWLLTSGALALYLMIVNLLVGGLLLIVSLLLWWLLLRWVISKLLGVAKDANDEEVSHSTKAYLFFGLTQLLGAACAVYFVLG